jgi:hypothetical protein
VVGVAATSASMRYMPALSSVSGIDDWAARRPLAADEHGKQGLGDRTKGFMARGRQWAMHELSMKNPAGGIARRGCKAG